MFPFHYRGKKRENNIFRCNIRSSSHPAIFFCPIGPKHPSKNRCEQQGFSLFTALDWGLTEFNYFKIYILCGQTFSTQLTLGCFLSLQKF